MIDRRHLLIGGGLVAVGGAGAAWAGLRGMGTMGDYDAAVAAMRAPLSAKPATSDLVRYATLAASGHNAQPWTFRETATGLRIAPDLSRRTPVVDPDDHHLFISLGGAAENLSIAAGARGKPGSVAFDPAEGGSVDFHATGGETGDPALFDAIPKRQSTRGDFDGHPVSREDLAALARAGSLPGVDLLLVTDRAQVDRLRDLVIAGNDAQMADPAFVQELKQWLRFNPAGAARTGDGLFSVASGNPSLPDWLGPRLFDWLVTAEGERDRYARQIASSAGLAVFVGQKADPDHWVRVGRASQRFALRATALGLKCSYVNQPVEVPDLRAALAGLVGLPGRRPDLVMRFGRGPALPFSARRPVDAVIA